MYKRQAIGTVGTGINFGNLAGRDEVCVLVTLDFLRDVHCRGGCNVECRIGRAQVVLSGAIAVDIEGVFISTAHAVVRVAKALVYGCVLSTVTRHVRHCLVHGLSGGSGTRRSRVEVRVKSSLDRVGDVDAQQGPSRAVVVLRDLDLDLAEVVLASIGVGQRRTADEVDLRRIIDCLLYTSRCV